MGFAIKLSHVSKRFKLYYSLTSGPLKELLFFWKRQQYYDEFMAVKDVSVEVQRGEVIGIIGSNGAGKTTLLKMIAGLLPVDEGTIEVNGHVTALLTLGVGVHPEFTGRENILYGGMLLGMCKAEVIQKTQAIIEFAELGEYIDHPVRTYSSGMRARLLFAISMSIKPDILIIDEALSTGDAYFVRKCSKRIREICRSGATILFVSHNMSQVEELCQRALLLDRGRLLADTDPNSAHRLYSQLVFEQETRNYKTLLSTELNRTGGTGEVLVSRVSLLDGNDNPKTGFHTFETLKVRIQISSLKKGQEIFLFVGFLDEQTNLYVGGVNTKEYYDPIIGQVTGQSILAKEDTVVEISFSPLYLLTGHYLLWIEIADRYRHIFSDYKGICPFFVSQKGATTTQEAYINHPMTIKILQPEEGKVVCKDSEA